MRDGGEGRSRLLLIVLIVSALFLITLDLRGVGVLEGARQGTQTILSPFQRAGSVVISPFKNFFSDVTHLGRTRNQIEKLRADNAKLRATLLNRKNADAQLLQLKSVLDLAGTAGFKVVNARVISQGASQSFSQTITIDAGTTAGIRKNMTVLAGTGITGVVKEVYSHTSLIMLATDPAFRIGVRIAGSQQIGILSGRGSRSGSLQLLDNQTNVKVGDVLLSRGSVANRPFVPGVPVGYVTAVDNSAGAIAQSATVHLYTNFSTLGVVSVVVAASKVNPGDALIPKKPRPTPVPTVTIYVTPSPSPTK
ncbi:MAG: cell shape-determining protein [Actinobacteria bacterium]|uniref:Cell shape-determining protein MreC n=1 Tax=freshwater metagenome TaxID=449393 RepID=A0A6J6RLS2_9ZZZZ|nr:cell shape-determining protein [Actinomycetota bacterium]MSY35703.1 cell shape-determining protein [Actinomycetota bacterium]MTA72436.1 cell shape-determining protein [Actinomycetota bacterium]MTB29317.1 cell shape-determining protein [Actinomycetota bacterium]MUH49095.1 cell shape-determining protein [Actinomycetota bacterium]